jgi:small redox-active disulfide protein 2
MKIQILGMGCPKCQTLEANAKAAVAKAGLDAEVVKVADADAIAEMGVMVTPALAVDGTVKKAGKVLSVDEIVNLIKQA